MLAQLEDEGYVQPAAHLGRAACRPTAATASTSTCCSRAAGAAKDAPAVEARLRAAGRRRAAHRRPAVHRLARARRRPSRARRLRASRPANEAAVFQRIEFVPLSGTRVLVVIVARGNQVTQKVVDIGEPLASDELAQAANYLNAEFSGLAARRGARGVLERLQQERTLYDQLLARALRLAQTDASTTADSRRRFTSKARRRCSTTSPTSTLSSPRCARCSRWSRRSSGWCGCSTSTSTVRPDRRHRRRAPRPGTAAVQPRSPSTYDRRRAHRHGRHHRPDAHALLARDRRRRRRRAGRRAGAARRQLTLIAAAAARSMARNMKRPTFERREPTPAPDGREPAPAQPAEADALQRERDELYDRLLRKTAEFDNYRKRVDRERTRAGDWAAADVAAATCCRSSTTSSARSQAPAPPDARQRYRKGVELIHAQMLDLLRKRGVSRSSVGADFDPHFHQAVAYDEVAGASRRRSDRGDAHAATCSAIACCGRRWSRWRKA